ncbi:hypothetical protein C8R44DRAFT_985752 [Mycena epipterygia]|nr:hypothetical protein C8R44DRAFT_985752 [Mycena epipterygia]
MSHSTPAGPATSLGSHILEIPSDVTTEIFLRCLPVHGRVRLACTAAPIVLSQVCSQWRGVAHSTSELWASLDIHYTSQCFEMHSNDAYYLNGFSLVRQKVRSLVDNAADTEALAFVETWFSRAKLQPLSLTLRSHYRVLPLRTLAFVSKFAPQLRRLELRGDMLLQPPLDRTVFPILQSLSVYLWSDFARDMAIVIAPDLREICFRGNITLPSTGEYLLLTSMECSDTCPHALLSCLNRFPQLLHITAQSRADEYGVEPEPATPLLLESLSLDQEDDETLPQSLSALTLPHLHHLALTMHSSPSTPASLAECLRAVPSLNTLDISVGHFLHILLDSLSPAESLLPNLRTLKISAFITIDFEQLIAVLEARASTLLAFHLALDDIHDPFEAGVLSHDQFDRICVNGFKITWGEQPETDDDECATFDL